MKILNELFIILIFLIVSAAII